MKYSNNQIKRIRDNLERYCKVGTKWGTFSVNKSETLEHNLKLAEQFVRLSYEGFAVAIRPELLNGRKPDLMVLNMLIPEIKEIMVTETEERFNSKLYMGLNKIKVKANGS